MLCPLLSRHQIDPATGKGEWTHQECLGAQCKFYNVPEADCQFLITSRNGNVALPTAVTGENLSASAALGVTAGREVAARVDATLKEAVESLQGARRETAERLGAEQSEALERLESAQETTLKRLESAQSTALKRLESAAHDGDARLQRLEEAVASLRQGQGEALSALARVEQRPGPEKELGALSEAIERIEKRPGPEAEVARLAGEIQALGQALGERQGRALEALERAEQRAGEEREERRQAERAREKTEERLQGLEGAQQEALHTLQAMRDSVTALPSRQEALGERLQVGFEEALRAQTEALGARLAEELKAAAVEQARQIESLGEGAVRNNGRLLQELKKSEQAFEKVSAALAEVRAAVERSPAEFQGLGKQVRDLHQFTHDALDASRQRAEGSWSQVETVGRSIGQLALIVKGLQGEVERANGAIGAARAENKSLLLAFHEQKLAQQEEQRRRHQEQARELNNKGVALFHRGSLEAAAEAFIRAVELKPDYAEAYNNLGLAYSRRGQSEEAVRYFQKALEIDPQMGEVYNNLGFLFHTGARYDRAVEMFTRSLQTGADQSIAYTNLGNTFYKMKQNEKAVVAWKKALEIDPLNESARRGLSMFQQEPAVAPAGRS